AKRKSNCSRVAEGKRLMKQFYSAIGNESIINFTEFLENYQGFDLASEDFEEATSLPTSFQQSENEKIESVPIPQLNSKGKRVHRKKEDRIKDEKYDNYFLDFVIKPETAQARRQIGDDLDNRDQELDFESASEIKEPKDFNNLLVHFRNKFHV
ncbi:MAG: hypothetical protein EZS28_052096, partial [Streblomastix strix]